MMRSALVLGGVVMTLMVSACEVVQALRGGGAAIASGDAVSLEQVVKGDEVTVRKDGANYRVRMLGIQAFAPVLADSSFLQKYAASAMTFLQEHGKGGVTVFFDAPVKDPYGRYLAYLQAGSNDVALQMIQAGIVSVYTEFPFARESAYLAAEANARRDKLGFWSDALAAATVAGLRKNWRDTRVGRGDKVLPDPVLTDAK